MSAHILEFPQSTLADVPQKLRELAGQIEAGEWGEVDECALVLMASSGVEVFGFGSRADAPTAHYLMSCAARKLEEPSL